MSRSDPDSKIPLPLIVMHGCLRLYDTVNLQSLNLDKIKIITSIYVGRSSKLTLSLKNSHSIFQLSLDLQTLVKQINEHEVSYFLKQPTNLTKESISSLDTCHSYVHA